MCLKIEIEENLLSITQYFYEDQIVSAMTSRVYNKKKQHSLLKYYVLTVSDFVALRYELFTSDIIPLSLRYINGRKIKAALRTYENKNS